MKTVTVKLSPELDHKVERLAAKLKRTKSVIIRLALEELVRRRDLAEKLSAFSMIEPYLGVLEDLPPSLSLAESHMKGYGAD